MYQRDYKHSEAEITYRMGYIKIKSRTYPRKHLLKGKSHKKGLCGGVYSAEHDSVQCTHYTVHYGSKPFRHSFREKHCHSPQHCPHVKVGYPPNSESHCYSVKEHVHVYGIQCLPAVYYSGCNDEHSQKVDIGKRLHHKVGHVHHCAKEGKYYGLSYVQPFIFQP